MINHAVAIAKSTNALAKLTIANAKLTNAIAKSTIERKN